MCTIGYEQSRKATNFYHYNYRCGLFPTFVLSSKEAGLERSFNKYFPQIHHTHIQRGSTKSGHQAPRSSEILPKEISFF